jgi:hypothetical protein
MLQVLRVVAIALVTVVAGSIGYAFAASNTGLSGAGGDGAGLISGYTVSDISYSLDSSDPTRLDAVNFAIDGGAATPSVVVKLVSDSDDWHPCVVSNAEVPARATCALDGLVAVADVDEVRVVAAQ